MARIIESDENKKSRGMSRGPKDEQQINKDSLNKFRFSGSIKGTHQFARPPRTHQSNRPHHNKVNTSQAFSAFGTSEHPTSARCTDSNNCDKFENQIIKETYKQTTQKNKEVLHQPDSTTHAFATIGQSQAITESQSKRTHRGSTGAATLVTDRAVQQFDNEIQEL